MILLLAHAQPAAHLHLADRVWVPLASLAALGAAALLARLLQRGGTGAILRRRR